MNVENFFGTDGIRGLYGQYPLTPADMWSLGWAVGRWILDQGQTSPFVFIGRDTRASGLALEEALTGGLTAIGVKVIAVGCAPTPAVAFLTRKHQAAMGLMISASHNPAPYNGVKFFNSAGDKISVVQEQAISRYIFQAQEKKGSGVIPLEQPDFLTEYTYFLQKNTPSIAPLRLVVDCAHGSYSSIAPRLLHDCGAHIVDVIGANPDGHNINAECGSVYPERLIRAVLWHNADAGIGFDGDGDRVVVVSKEGVAQDGDQILAALAREERREMFSSALVDHDSSSLRNNYVGHHTEYMHGDRLDSEFVPMMGVVGTVVSNLGLEHFLKSQAIPFVRTDVGDRWIGQKLKELNWKLGGEPCGHIILADALPTGDGLLAGLRVLHHMGKNQNLFPIFQPTPSVMLNMTLHKADFSHHPKFLEYQQHLQSMLHQESRVLLRTSGTEPLLRILVEGPCSEYVAHLAGSIAQKLNQQQNDLD